VARVPYEREPPARPEYARYLRQGRVVIEPVERLCGGYDVGRRVRQRDRLGAPGERSSSRQSNLELRAHLVEWLDCHDAVPECNESARELSRACTEVDDVEGLRACEPANG